MGDAQIIVNLQGGRHTLNRCADGSWIWPNDLPTSLPREPLTVAANVLAHGTGALNIDGCRYAFGDSAWPGPGEVGTYPASLYGEANRHGIYGSRSRGPEHDGDHPDSARHNALGRFPANVYACPKASRSEREAGCDHLPADPRTGRRNRHVSVKPVRLMRWLCRLVTPPGGLVLDPFAGSGTTGVAALVEGFRFLGCERDPEHLAVARARVGAAAGRRRPRVRRLRRSGISHI